MLTLRQQLLQHVIAEETHQASEQVAEMERKVMELQAREIMLKHANDEQAGRIGTLQRANHELRDTIERQEKKHTSTLQTVGYHGGCPRTVFGLTLPVPFPNS